MTSGTLWLPILITVLAWWISTGLILLLVRLPRRLHNGLLIGFAGLAILSVWGLIGSAQRASELTIYCGFFCALTIWGWHEASFLMGKITGPRPLPCPEGVVGWRRFSYATGTLIYHEIALFVTCLILAAATFGAPNQMGVWTFLALFVLRLSAKFNIFLGVPNLTQEFFPDHLAHLKTYLPTRAMNPLMPASLLCAALAILYLLSLLGDLNPGDPLAIKLTILITLIGLGALEHVFMITPLPDAALWRWAAPRKGQKSDKNPSQCDRTI
jgi:putative photosynthetic complex assembly protein 2